MRKENGRGVIRKEFEGEELVKEICGEMLEKDRNMKREN